jgi:hypothetical protein
MIYFPDAVFKNILSFIPRPIHPTAQIIKQNGCKPYCDSHLGPYSRDGCILLWCRAYASMAQQRYGDYQRLLDEQIFHHLSCPFRPYAFNPTLATLWNKKLSVKEIKKILKDNGIKGYSRKKKAELVSLLMSY